MQVFKVKIKSSPLKSSCKLQRTNGSIDVSSAFLFSWQLLDFIFHSIQVINCRLNYIILRYLLKDKMKEIPVQVLRHENENSVLNNTLKDLSDLMIDKLYSSDHLNRFYDSTTQPKLICIEILKCVTNVRFHFRLDVCGKCFLWYFYFCAFLQP